MPVLAQQMIVHGNDGSEVKFDNPDYASCRITFSEGEMIVHTGASEQKTFDIKSIGRISFYGLQSGVVAPTANKLSYAPINKAVLVNECPGLVAAIYHVNGACVLSRLLTIATSEISVAHLPAGAYVVVVGGETLKFIKQ